MTDTTVVYLAVGPFCWGRGSSEEAAIKEMRKNWSTPCAGKYSITKIAVFKITGDPEPYVDDMGYIIRLRTSSSEVIRSAQSSKAAAAAGKS